ncbi:helix-turn-helix domain-containing protein [Mixta calida]|uniref:helix-turn-helix domain-containing protein n=1 Tax=Mixta calida TaxID=665913 RepID=UPI003D54931E
MINKVKFSVTPLEKAVAAVGGSQKELAEKIGVSPQAITLIKKRGGRLPLRRMNAFVAATGLSKEELYPEFFTAA